MSIACVCRATIKASPADCFAALADARGWTHWVRDVDRMEVLDPGTAGGPARVRATATLGGNQAAVLLDVLSSPESNAVSFELVEGPGIEAVVGALEFTPVPTGSVMAADIKITLARDRSARIERMLSRRIETVLTRDFVRFVERAHRR